MPLIIVNTKNKIALFRPLKATLRKKSRKDNPHNDKLKKQEFVIL